MVGVATTLAHAASNLTAASGAADNGGRDPTQTLAGHTTGGGRGAGGLNDRGRTPSPQRGNDNDGFHNNTNSIIPNNTAPPPRDVLLCLHHACGFPCGRGPACTHSHDYIHCRRCSTSFASRQLLADHMRVSHGDLYRTAERARGSAPGRAQRTGGVGAATADSGGLNTTPRSSDGTDALAPQRRSPSSSRPSYSSAVAGRRPLQPQAQVAPSSAPSGGMSSSSTIDFPALAADSAPGASPTAATTTKPALKLTVAIPPNKANTRSRPLPVSQQLLDASINEVAGGGVFPPTLLGDVAEGIAFVFSDADAKLLRASEMQTFSLRMYQAFSTASASAFAKFINLKGAVFQTHCTAFAASRSARVCYNKACGKPYDAQCFCIVLPGRAVILADADARCTAARAEIAVAASAHLVAAAPASTSTDSALSRPSLEAPHMRHLRETLFLLRCAISGTRLTEGEARVVDEIWAPEYLLRHLSTAEARAPLAGECLITGFTHAATRSIDVCMREANGDPLFELRLSVNDRLVNFGEHFQNTCTALAIASSSSTPLNLFSAIVSTFQRLTSSANPAPSAVDSGATALEPVGSFHVPSNSFAILPIAPPQGHSAQTGRLPQRHRPRRPGAGGVGVLPRP